MSRRRSLLAGLLGAGLATAVFLAPRALDRAPRLPEPSYLPATARALLHERMRRHVEDLAQLNRAVVALDFSTTQQLADQIASEPKLGRPLQQDATELNSQLPERFFLLQDDLQRSARDLANAAQARDDARVSSAHAAMTQTCVACHRAYVDGRDRGTPKPR